MTPSLGARALGAGDRWRGRLVYERLRPELSVADVLSRVDPTLSIGHSDRPFTRLLEAHLAHTPRTAWDGAAPATPNDVDRARRGEWQLLGRTLLVSPATDWHRDPVFGATWPRRYAGSLSLLRNGGDVVTLWHLNKMVFLLDLAAAYRTTREPDLAARIYDLIDSWCVANPYLVGVNWVSPLDISTRLWVWSQALAAITDAAPPAEDRTGRIVRAVVRQADHVVSHFSEWPIPNNHLLGEAAMVFAFAAYWPVWKDAASWMARTESILVSESQRQVLNDGVQYEASVNYHAYSLDFFLLYLHAKALRGESPHPVVAGKARAMATAFMELVMPSGRQPRIGDDTIDRFFVLAHALDGPPLAPDQSTFADFVRPEHARVLATASWGRDLLDVSVPARHARHFADAGISVARTAEAAVVFAHGPQHRQIYSHGHLHADAGSFELEIEGVPVVVDAGTYVYFVDTQARDYFRSARAHNAPVVDEMEPMRGLEPFRWETVAAGEYLGFGATAESIGVGNRRKLPGADGVHMEHTRALVVSFGTVLVLDSIRVGDQSPVAARTHLARICFRTPTPAGTASSDGARVRLADPRRFARVVEAFTDQKAHVELVDDPADRACWYSSRYGELRHGVAVRVSAEFEERVVILSAIRSTEVSVVPLRLDPADTLVAIESHAGRRLVRVRFDPLSIVAGGKTVVGRGAEVVDFAKRRDSSSSSAPAWLDELSLGS